MNNQPDLSAIEQKIQAAYQTIHPRAGFAAALRVKVDSRARMKKTSPRFFLSYRLAMVGITLVLILTAVFAIGPQTILARARALFGFIPGVGFVEEPSAVHLCQPVEVTQNGATLKIDQAGGGGGELHINGSVSNGGESGYVFFLVDPQGNEARQLNWGSDGEQGDFTFELVYRLTSSSRAWTLASALPGEEISADLVLCPGSQPSTSDSSIASLYTPSNAVARGKGMSFQIQQVAQLNGITAIKVETLPDGTDASSPVLGTPYLFANYVELTDDLGNHYALHEQNMPGVLGGPITSFEFDPIRTEARRAILRIQQIDLDDGTSVPFALDLGGIPQPDQTWNLQDTPGSEYQINGYTISLLSARYAKERESASYFSDVDRDIYTLEFTARVTPPTADYMPISAKLEIGNYNYMSTGSPVDGTLLLKAFFDKPLTDQPVTGSIGWLGGKLIGPWEIQWDLPK